MANFRITELDFDSIKSNLKDFLRQQDTLNSYDFEGSALSVLIDLLAYNTHYNAYLANMLANEMFLDSAVKRESAVSIARHLGFVPRSARGAVAKVNFSIADNTTGAAVATLEKYSLFNFTINGKTYPFVNIDAVNSFGIGNTYNFTNVELKQGTPEIYRFTVRNPGPDEKYVIPNDNIDTTSISVSVQTSATDTTTTTYKLVSSIDGVDGTYQKGRVCFLEENQFGKYQLYFGDGVVGYKLTAGNIINVEYVITRGAEANSLPTEEVAFTLNTVPTNLTTSTLLTRTVLSKPNYGSAKQTINEIKFLAPLIRAAQDRAVTKNDYEALILNNKPQIESISVWGGEENDPPVYGKIFISAKPIVGQVLSEATKEEIKNDILATRKVLALTPEVVDPDYLYVGLNITVKFNSNIAGSSASKLNSLIRLKTENYFNNELEKFNKKFIYYKFLNEIDSLDESITSILTSIKIQRRLDLRLNTTNEFSRFNSIKMYNKIHPNSVRSTYFTYQDSDGVLRSAYFKDNGGLNPDYNGSGTLELWTINPITNVSSLALPNQGLVNYATGEISTKSFIPRGYPAALNDFRFTADVQEANYDVTVSKNILITLDDSLFVPTAGLSAGLNISVISVSE